MKVEGNVAERRRKCVRRELEYDRDVGGKWGKIGGKAQDRIINRIRD